MTRTTAAGLEAYQADADLRAAKERLGEALPDDGWLGAYLRACVPLTDAPVEFHLAAGLSALAGALGNRRWRPGWGITVYPALWTVLVAPSSFWRKSTSISLAERLLRDADPGAVLPSDFSRERFLELLAARPDAALTVKEFGGFLANLGRDYMGGMMETLTELYDGPDAYVRSLKSGTITITRPSLTILAATTLDWLEKRITEDALAGGFLARFLFVTAATKASPKGLTEDMDASVRNGLVRSLHVLVDRPSYRVDLSPAARELYDDWMAGWEAEVTAEHHRSDLTGFAVRLQMYALKFAMLYRASAVVLTDPDADRVVDERSMTQAIAYARVLWRNVTGLIDDDIAISREAKDLRRIAGIIGAGISRSDALKRSKMKARDFNQYLDTLVESSQVVITKRRASELGLDRDRDRLMDWLTVLRRNGHEPTVPPLSTPPTVPENRRGSEGEPEGGELEGNPRGTVDPDSLSSSLSTSLHTHIDAMDAHGHARGGTGNRNRKAERAADDQSGGAPEDRPPDQPMRQSGGSPAGAIEAPDWMAEGSDG